MTTDPSDATPLHTAVFQALGTASVCWTPRPEGVFDSEQASRVGYELIAKIHELYGQSDGAS